MTYERQASCRLQGNRSKSGHYHCSLEDRESSGGSRLHIYEVQVGIREERKEFDGVLFDGQGFGRVQACSIKVWALMVRFAGGWRSRSSSCTSVYF